MSSTEHGRKVFLGQLGSQILSSHKQDFDLLEPLELYFSHDKQNYFDLIWVQVSRT